MPGTCSGKKRIASPRQKRLPDALSDDQVRQLLSGIRNRVHKTCLTVMYACGLRISEATTLEIRAIDRANHVLRIVGKGDKERLVPLPQPALDELGCLWRTHRNRRWLFPNHTGDAPPDGLAAASLLNEDGPNRSGHLHHNPPPQPAPRFPDLADRGAPQVLDCLDGSR